jgi:hypothetical protein
MNGGENLTGFHRYNMDAYANAFDFARPDARENRLLLRRKSAAAKGQEHDAITVRRELTAIAIIGESPRCANKQNW